MDIARFLAAGSLAFALLAGASPASAQSPHGADRKGDASGSGPGIFSLLPDTAKTEHSITVDGKTLAYTAEAGTLPLLAGDGSPTARIFYVAYRAEDGSNTDGKGSDGQNGGGSRPITFVFNGGPGAASAYLQLGALGPRVLKTNEDGSFRAPPQELEDNPDTWLTMSDLVFVDPVGTGYSRAAPGQKESDFWGVRTDAQAMAAFIRLYLLQAGRTASPVYLAGESYGGFRAALLARTLQEDTGITPEGITMISPALDFSFIYGGDHRPLDPALLLPSMAAVNLAKHGVTGEAFGKRIAAVQDYALHGYLTALASGRSAGGRAASERVAEITGLPLARVRERDARVSATDFVRWYDRADGEILSIYDGTVETADIAPDSDRDRTPDPILERSVPVVTGAFVNYVRTALNYRTKVSYRLLNKEIAGKWDYGGDASSQGYADALDDLQEARALNPSMKVLIVNGYTDLVTPYMVSRYLVNQLPPLKGAAPIRTAVYPGGHMMYLRSGSRHALYRDAQSVYGAGQAE
ncbi:S10 family peptidase [Pararhizobium mangrovi]|uniref:Peptidase S10 n=1 Tax=Pararhizobium mangrovi TaxID=2590452 RepID=A0A506U218_9HYPH|nr:peptidase S10 [Pararhizobium mangrovi]TPW25907.1 peptidase S10 [Pararhizobium mangrovi]